MERTFAEWLRYRRERKGISVQDLAKQVGVTDRMIQLMEKGERMPGLELSARLARALGVSVALVAERARL